MGRITRLFGDREFFAVLLKIALPITIQQLALSLLNVIDVLMIGQLGETAVAGVGLANQIFFLLNLLLFGIVSGSAIFTAQFWGRRDLASIRQVMGIGLLLSVAGSLAFTAIAVLAPQRALSFYSNDPAVVAQGSAVSASSRAELWCHCDHLHVLRRAAEHRARQAADRGQRRRPGCEDGASLRPHLRAPGYAADGCRGRSGGDLHRALPGMRNAADPGLCSPHASRRTSERTAGRRSGLRTPLPDHHRAGRAGRDGLVVGHHDLLCHLCPHRHRLDRGG